jgi:dihydrodipicolinate synthase/N-acetylneuraminate lyase
LIRSKRDQVGWKGYLPAIVTPFGEDLQIDYPGLNVMLDWLVAEGMHGLVVAGTTGEWTSLSAGERTDLFSAVGRRLAGKLPLIAGCTSFTGEEVLRFANHAAASRFDGILVTPPPYVHPSDDEIFHFYAGISRSSPLPICVYNWPPGTGIDMPLALLRRLAQLDNVVAIKQSTSNLRHFVDTFFALNDEVRVFGHSMDEHGLALLQSRGGDGTMGAGAPLGRVHADFYNHLWRGDIEAARRCGLQDRAIMNDWYTPDLVGRFGSGPGILKAALVLQGVPAGRVRPPLQDVSPAGVKLIRQTLARLGRVA